ncbi:MAG: hypothetical protein P9L99_16575 [Candidatus Lernaella stagnicola]|nr:hypothetical protein [Candidatus Lernaella stagnicola]
MAVLSQQGVGDPNDIPVGMINKVVAITRENETIVLGSVKDVNINITEERYTHKDNARYAQTVMDVTLAINGEVTFTVEEWNDDNLELLTGKPPDMDGRFYLGLGDVPPVRLEFYHEHHDGRIFCFGVYKAKISSDHALNLSPNTNYPLPVRATILTDGSGEYGTPIIDGKRPLVYIDLGDFSGDGYGYGY